MKLNLNEKLDFNDIDLTAPNIVVEEILAELPTETNGIIAGQIKAYSGPVFSYKKTGLSGLGEMQTRSNSASSALLRASSIDTTPTICPSASIRRT